MDKFGIFNLLSSLLGDKNGENAPDPSVLSPKNLPQDNAQAEKRATLAPLQNSMLATMQNHEEFVKRVKTRVDKNNK